MIIASSLSTSAIDKIRKFASQHSILWNREFPYQLNLVDAACPQVTNKPAIEVVEESRGRKKQCVQKYILVIRAEKGWCKRTVKYLYGLAWFGKRGRLTRSGAWIVTMDWIDANLASDHLIPPDAFEVVGDKKTKVQNAPRLSRLSHEKGNPGIFNGIFFFVRVQDTGDGIPLNILLDLMQRCGCVKSLEDMGYRGKSMRVIEVVEKLTSSSSLDEVTVDWVLNCIGSWKVL